MNRVRKTLFTNKKGLTLVEVLASIVILSIIVISILMILLQTMKTNKTSEEIINATYVAQSEMENIYAISKKTDPSLESSGYSQAEEANTFEKNKDSFIIKITLIDTEDRMKRVIIKVYDLADPTKPKAQMENLFKWGAVKDEVTP